MYADGKLVGIVDEDSSRDDYTHVLAYRCDSCGNQIDGFYINLSDIEDIDEFIEAHRPPWNEIFDNFIKCYNCGAWLVNKLKEK